MTYAHPHPISPETSKIKNTAGLQLASELDETPVSEYLIDETEQMQRENEYLIFYKIRKAQCN